MKSLKYGCWPIIFRSISPSQLKRRNERKKHTCDSLLCHITQDDSVIRVNSKNFLKAIATKFEHIAIAKNKRRGGTKRRGKLLSRDNRSCALSVNKKSYLTEKIPLRWDKCKEWMNVLPWERVWSIFPFLSTTLTVPWWIKYISVPGSPITVMRDFDKSPAITRTFLQYVISGRENMRRKITCKQLNEALRRIFEHRNLIRDKATFHGSTTYRFHNVPTQK